MSTSERKNPLKQQKPGKYRQQIQLLKQQLRLYGHRADAMQQKEK